MDVVENGEIVTKETLGVRSESKGKARKWNDEERDLLIDLLDDGLCQLQ